MTDFAQSLKTWRRARRFSQLELAGEADVSARHISFLETGRSRPSPEMIGRLGDALHLPLAARNQLMTQAGFAARYPGRAWDTDDMAPVRAAVRHMLASHAPYPGIAIDRVWTILEMNAPAQKLFGVLGVAEGASLLDMMVSPALPPLIENWAEVAHHVAQRLRVESAAQGGVSGLDQVAAFLSNVPFDNIRDRLKPLSPVVPTILNIGSARLSLFATIAQFGTPDDLSLDDLKVELYFPTDAESERTLKALTEN
jgi:transcriptional regulator with XRE-family HTH domain